MCGGAGGAWPWSVDSCRRLPSLSIGNALMSFIYYVKCHITCQVQHVKNRNDRSGVARWSEDSRSDRRRDVPGVGYAQGCARLIGPTCVGVSDEWHVDLCKSRERSELRRSRGFSLLVATCVPVQMIRGCSNGPILRVLQRPECANTHFAQTIFQIGFTEIYVPFVCRTDARKGTVQCHRAPKRHPPRPVGLALSQKSRV